MKFIKPTYRFFLRGAGIVLAAFIFGTGHADAQIPLSNLRQRTVSAQVPVQVLDTSTVAVPLISIADSAGGYALDAGIFRVYNNLLYTDTAALHKNYPECRSIRLQYRVLPGNMGSALSRLDTALIRKAARDNAIEFDFTPYAPPTPLLGASGLNSSGAYTRGLSFGNSQNLVFNSNLNLQLDGRLGNDLSIRAAISDNSIPLQPDGSTRQLQEFDRVYIQLQRRKTLLTAGDFDLTRPTEGYFSNYFKRLQGAQLETHTKAGTVAGKFKNDSLTVRTAAGVSKGKFARQSIAGAEGNQGPYRLQGAEGERFIIVLAGTEKVYIDGILLQRGLADDYVIDYNLGELTFTQRRLITKDSRIIVEFEYAVQAYLRSTAAASTSWEHRKQRFYFNAYSEQDSRNAGGAQDLSAAERQGLALAGDQIQQAYVSGIDTLSGEFDPARVQYKQVDTLVCGVLRQILVYSANPDSALYTARFSEVPAGQGNYVLAQSSANGRVYRWVAPDPGSCLPTGNFEPVVRLLAPEMRQLFAVGAVLKPGKNTLLKTEFALSNRDLNRYSPLGNNDNLGGSAWLDLRQDIWPAGRKKGWTNQLSATYEASSPFFQAVNPYRPAEYLRDWNLSATDDKRTEHIARGGFNVQKKQLGGLRYETGVFLRVDQYTGVRHFAQARIQRNGFDVFLEGNLLQSDGTKEKTNFFRPKIDVSKTFFSADSVKRKPLFQLGIYGEREKNDRRLPAADTLLLTSFRYDMGKIYCRTPDSTRTWQFGASFLQRNDYAPLITVFRQNTLAREANLNGAWKPKSKKTGVNRQLVWNLTWRTLDITDTTLSLQKPQNTYLGRVDFTQTAWKNAFSLTAGYEIGAGQSPKIQYNYVVVNPGEGQYTWVDRNRDSTLQIDEMEIAVFQDQANYIRVAVTTTDFILTNNVAYNQNLRLDPRLIWGQSKRRWQKTLSRLSAQSTLQINRKVYAGIPGVEPWNPFDLNVADTALVTVAAVVRNALFLNRANPVWDISIAQTDARNRLVVTTGFESRRTADQTLHGRVNLGKKWSAEADISRGNKDSETENFTNRNFSIQSWSAGPKISWMPTRNFRLVAEYKWKQSQNVRETGVTPAEMADQSALTGEMTWNPVGKPNSGGFKAATSIRARATLSKVNFNGQANSAIAYNMLEGLQNGKNYLWSLNLDRQLSQTMQLSLQYEGRKTGENRIIHVGRAQIRAVF